MMYKNKKIKLILLVLAVFLAISILPWGVAADDDDETWRARYYDNRNVAGDPVKKRDEDAIDHDWGDGSPMNGVPDDDFSARWTRTVYLNAGVYRFSATMDDGMRVWIDDALVIDEWQDSQVRTVFVDLPMTAGDHEIEVHYYEAGGKAVAKFWWGGAGAQPGTPQNRWQGAYYNNMYLGGPPVYTRADAAINFNWKEGSPWPTVYSDHFSARWTGNFDHTPGNYRFTVRTDDGVRLWVNDQLLIDEWHDNQDVTYQADMALPGGSVPLRLDYYENMGAALIMLETAQVSGSTAPPTQPATPPGLPPAGQAVVTNANWLNVRATPEMGDNVITAVPRGEVVTLIGRYGGWVKVRLPNGVEGWVAGKYLASRTPPASLPVVQ